MKNSGPYIVRAYQFQGANGCEIETATDTLAEAKRLARRYLSEDERILSESAHRLGYASVEKSAGECVADYINDKNVLTPMLESEDIAL